MFHPSFPLAVAKRVFASINIVNTLHNTRYVDGGFFTLTLSNWVLFVLFVSLLESKKEEAKWIYCEAVWDKKRMIYWLLFFQRTSFFVTASCRFIFAAEILFEWKLVTDAVSEVEEHSNLRDCWMFGRYSVKIPIELLWKVGVVWPKPKKTISKSLADSILQCPSKELERGLLD